MSKKERSQRELQGSHEALSAIKVRKAELAERISCHHALSPAPQSGKGGRAGLMFPPFINAGMRPEQVFCPYIGVLETKQNPRFPSHV